MNNVINHNNIAENNVKPMANVRPAIVAEIFFARDYKDYFTKLHPCS